MIPTPAVKPGYQTSELYVTCGASIAAFVAALASPDLTGKITTGIIAGIAVAGYIYTRYQAKMAAQKQTDEQAKAHQ